MKHPSQPDTMPDEYIADLPSAHRTPPTHPNPEGTGVNPIDIALAGEGEQDHAVAYVEARIASSYDRRRAV